MKLVEPWGLKKYDADPGMLSSPEIVEAQRALERGDHDTLCFVDLLEKRCRLSGRCVRHLKLICITQPSCRTYDLSRI